jgi:Rrf2 family protein
MLQITRKADYAVRLMMEVAAHPGEIVNTAQVAKRQDIPRQFLRKVAQTLTMNGLLVSERGGNGGLILARPADQITVLDILRAVDVLAVNDCTIAPDSCQRRAMCAAYPFWFEAQREMERVLAQTPLSKIARSHLALEAMASRSILGQTAPEPGAERPGSSGRQAPQNGNGNRPASERYGFN